MQNLFCPIIYNISKIYLFSFIFFSFAQICNANVFRCIAIELQLH